MPTVSPSGIVTFSGDSPFPALSDFADVEFGTIGGLSPPPIYLITRAEAVFMTGLSLAEQLQGQVVSGIRSDQYANSGMAMRERLIKAERSGTRLKFQGVWYAVLGTATKLECFLIYFKSLEV